MVFKEDGNILSWARTCPGRQETQSTAVLWCQDGWGRTLSERQSHPIFVPASSGCRTVNRRLDFPTSSPLANCVDGWIFSFPVVDNTAFQFALLKLIAWPRLRSSAHILPLHHSGSDGQGHKSAACPGKKKKKKKNCMMPVCLPSCCIHRGYAAVAGNLKIQPEFTNMKVLLNGMNSVMVMRSFLVFLCRVIEQHRVLDLYIYIYIYR